jgi:hypothetical protein
MVAAATGSSLVAADPFPRDARQNSEMTIPTYGEWNHFVSAARTVQLHTFGSLEGRIMTFVR